MIKKMIKLLKKNGKCKIRNFTRSVLGKDNYIRIRFILTHGYIGDFTNPKTWNEKIQNRKLFCVPDELCHFVDKYEVREYVSNVIGSQYLIPLIATFDKLKVNDIRALPKECVIKTTNGGGGANVRIINDLSLVDPAELVSFFNSEVSKKLGLYIDEPFYDVLPARIVVEKLIRNSDGSSLLDYKFHVFKSRNKTNVFLQINSDYGLDTETKTLYDLNGKRLKVQFSDYKHGQEKLNLPVNFDDMVNLAVKLASRFKYARVDFYNVDGRIYFGEITFCPASGWDKINSKENDLYLGSLWE